MQNRGIHKAGNDRRINSSPMVGVMYWVKYVKFMTTFSPITNMRSHNIEKKFVVTLR